MKGNDTIIELVSICLTLRRCLRFSLTLSLLLSTFAAAQVRHQNESDLVQRITVVDDINGTPVESSIYACRGSGCDTREPNDGGFIGKVYRDRPLILEYNCNGIELWADPAGEGYYYSRPHRCENDIVIRVVHKLTALTRLKMNLDIALKQDNYAIAAHISNEIATFEKSRDGPPPERLTKLLSAGKYADVVENAKILAQNSDISTIGVIAEDLTIIFAARALNSIDGVVFDRAQHKLVMSTKLQEQLKQFQKSEGIGIKGALDYSTLSRLSGKSSSSLIYTRVG